MSPTHARIILASNRLPVVIGTLDGRPSLNPSSGGLASALREYHEAEGGWWVGWLGDSAALDEEALAGLLQQAEQKKLRYGTTTSSPVQFLYRSVPSDELLALYRAADVMLVTPLRDGMNLVAKEYVAARLDGLGCLVLSEFAGAAAELAAAITVNPYDILGLSAAIERALHMSEEEQKPRMRALRDVVGTATVQARAAAFLRDLAAIQATAPALLSAAAELEHAFQQLVAAEHRTLLLDYDGTLTPIVELPSLATPSKQLLTLLGRLADAPGTVVHVVTGRSQQEIEAWLGTLPIWLHAEHGLRSRRPDNVWLPCAHGRPASFETAERIMSQYAKRTPGAFVEPKAASVAFHYRQANTVVAHSASIALKDELRRTLGDDVRLLHGHKVLELRSRDVAKSIAVRIALANSPSDSVVLASGDDRTDEDMFSALPELGVVDPRRQRRERSQAARRFATDLALAAGTLDLSSTSPVSPSAFGLARPLRVSAPLTPRAHVQFGTGQARAFQREQGVTRGDAGAAMHDGLRGRAAAEGCKVQLPQLLGAFERSVRLQVVSQGNVDGARDVARDGIDRLVVAAVARGCSHVDHAAVGGVACFVHFVDRSARS